MPLDSKQREIRLLQILPGHQQSAIEAKLESVSLNEKPQFNVLSYAWGSSDEQKSILIQDHEFSVSNHLYQCLVNLRLESEPLFIWIDAICINQNSVDEKNTQVPLMRDVYQSAKQVHVWLGVSTPGLELVLASINALVLRGPDFKLGSFEQLIEGLNRASPEAFVGGVAEIVHLGWFRRTWIIQEVALPRQDPIFVCGRHRIQWTDLARWKRVTSDYNDNLVDHARLAASDPAWQRLHAMIDFHPFGGLMTMRNIFQNSKRSKDGMELSSLLFFSQESLATDPRDKVYGVMGLADAAARSNITIDYNKGVTDLFEEITRYLIFKEGKMNHIALPRRNIISQQGAGVTESCHTDGTPPSWIRDFTFKPPPKNSESPLIPDWCGRSKLYDASLRSGTVQVGEIRPRELRIVGMKLDIVEECAVAWYQIPGNTRILKNWKNILPVYFRVGREDVSPTTDADHVSTKAQAPSSSNYPWGLIYSPGGKPLKTMKEAIWRTVMADKTLDEFKRPPDWYGSFIQGYVESYVGAQSTNIVVDGAPPGMEASEAVEEFHKFQHRLGNVMVGRSAFRTRDGWIGLGPDSTKGGDLIAILSGGDAPFVLRPCHDHYHVVGNCYVEGVMYGEVARASMEGNADEGAPTIPGEVLTIR